MASNVALTFVQLQKLIGDNDECAHTLKLIIGYLRQIANTLQYHNEIDHFGQIVVEYCFLIVQSCLCDDNGNAVWNGDDIKENEFSQESINSQILGYIYDSDNDEADPRLAIPKSTMNVDFAKRRLIARHNVDTDKVCSLFCIIFFFWWHDVLLRVHYYLLSLFLFVFRLGCCLYY